MEINKFITTPTSEDEYNDIINNFFLWLKRQPQMQKHMNKDKVSTLVFQLGYSLIEGEHGQKFLYPMKTAIQHDSQFPAYWKDFEQTGNTPDLKAIHKKKATKKKK